MHTPTFSPVRPSFSVFFTRFRFFRPHQLATSEIFAPRAPFFLLPSFGTPLSPHKPLSPLSPLSPHKPLSPIAFFFLGASLLALANTLAFFWGWLLAHANTPPLRAMASHTRAWRGYVLTSLRAYAYALFRRLCPLGIRRRLRLCAHFVARIRLRSRAMCSGYALARIRTAIFAHQADICRSSASIPPTL